MFDNDNENDIHNNNVDYKCDDNRSFEFSVMIAKTIVKITLLHKSMWK